MRGTKRPLVARQPANADPCMTVESLVHRVVASDRPLDTEAFVVEVTRLVDGYLTPR